MIKRCLNDFQKGSNLAQTHLVLIFVLALKTISRCLTFKEEVTAIITLLTMLKIVPASLMFFLILRKEGDLTCSQVYVLKRSRCFHDLIKRLKVTFLLVIVLLWKKRSQFEQMGWNPTSLLIAFSCVHLRIYDLQYKF